MFRFDFTRRELDNIAIQCLLSDVEHAIVLERIKNKSITKIALELSMSESTVKRHIKKAHKKINKLF